MILFAHQNNTFSAWWVLILDSDLHFSGCPVPLRSQGAVSVSHVEWSSKRVVNSQHYELYSARLPHTLIWQIDYHRAAMLLTFICDLPLCASLSLAIYIYIFIHSLIYSHAILFFLCVFCSVTVTSYFVFPFSTLLVISFISGFSSLVNLVTMEKY